MREIKLSYATIHVTKKINVVRQQSESYMESSAFKNPPKNEEKTAEDYESLPPPNSVVTIPRYNGMLSAPSAMGGVGSGDFYDPMGIGGYSDTAANADFVENEIDIGGGYYRDSGDVYSNDLDTASTTMPEMGSGMCLMLRILSFLLFNF